MSAGLPAGQLLDNANLRRPFARREECMWLVVDTNQAGLIPSTLGGARLADGADGLTVPPYILAEIVRLGEYGRRDTLTALRRHKVRIGLEPAQVFDGCAG
jgi:spore maturation protein SpmA